MKRFKYQGITYNKYFLKAYWKDENAFHFIIDSKEFIIPLTSGKLAEVYVRFDERIGKDEDMDLDSLLKM